MRCPPELPDLAAAEIEHVDPGQRLLHRLAIGLPRQAQEAHMAIAPHHHDVLDQNRKGPVDLLSLGDIGDKTTLQRPLHSSPAITH